MGIGAVKAGEAFVRVFSDDADLVRGLRGLEARLSKIGGTVSNVGKGIATAGAGVAAMGGAILAPFAAGVKSFVSFGDELNKMAARTGFSSEALSELGFAAEQSGADLAAVETSVRKMQQAITAAGDGTTTMVEAFETLGLSFEQLQGLNPDQQFQAIAAEIAKIEDPTERAARAMEIFGKSGTKLLPLITSDIQALRDEAKALGITLSTDDANAAAELGDAINRVGRGIKATFIKLGAAVAPAITKALGAVKTVTSWVAKWVDENRGLTRTIAAIGAGMVAVGTAIASVGGLVVGLGVSISAVASILGTLASIATAVGTAVGVPFAMVAVVAAGVVLQFAAVAAAVAAVGAGIVYLANDIGVLVPAWNWVKESILAVFGTFKQTFGGMVSALGSGKFGLAAQIAWQGVKVATLQGSQSVLQGIEYLWKNAGALTIVFLQRLGGLIVKAFSSLPKLAFAALRGGAGVVDTLNEILAGAFTGGNISGALDSVIEDAQKKLDALTLEANAAAPGAPAIGATPGAIAAPAGVSVPGAMPTAAAAQIASEVSAQQDQVSNAKNLALAFFNGSAPAAATAQAAAVTNSGPGVELLVPYLGESVLILKRIANQGGLT